MIGQIDQTLARASQKAALGLGALMCFAAGAGFLTGAAWIWMVAVADTLVAATVIGAVYLGAGAILLGFALLRKPPPAVGFKAHPRPAPDNPPPATPPLMAAFVYGMQAGMEASSKE